jgi:DinB superfamily
MAFLPHTLSGRSLRNSSLGLSQVGTSLLVPALQCEAAPDGAGSHPDHRGAHHARRTAALTTAVIDFEPYRSGAKALPEIAIGLTAADLGRLTDEMCDLQLQLISPIEDPDVTFTPDDPEANDTFAATPEEVGISWTLGHVIVHTTASSEEAAANALNLARGVEILGRSRSEVPWQSVRTAAQIRARVDESRRMRLAMIQAWPDQPNLDLTYTAREGTPPRNAVAQFIGGLAHDDSHLGQVRRIVSEAREAREKG